MIHRTALLALSACAALAGCSGLFHSQAPLAAVYELHAGAQQPAARRVAAVLAVARPRVAPGLDSERIAVVVGDRRLDAYAGARWSAPLGELAQALLVSGLRDAAGWQAVVPEQGEFGGKYLLQPEVAEFTAHCATAGVAPTIRVRLHAELGLSATHRLIASIDSESAVEAAADRQGAVTAAFEAAYGDAARKLIDAVNAAGDAAERAAPP